MAFKKIGENLSFATNNILPAKKALADEHITKRFIKLAKSLRKVAPRAEDFLYGHAVMMHAAEACLVDQNTGEPVKSKSGEQAKGWFEKTSYKGKDSVKWISPDGLKPYKNANGDIFPEEELKKAYKNWVGKPLCKDHKSDSVDGIRGIIIDTFYDPKFKRVHALFALDKKNYADLARKVETGYANCVSMGTGVGRSVCTECSNVATTERDYCNCIRTKANYGEINLDLSPIELSLVVNGADGLAKIRQIVASMNDYVVNKQKRIAEIQTDRCVNPTELQAIADSVKDMQTKLAALMPKEAEMDEGQYLAALNRLQEEDDPDTKAVLQKMIEEYEAKHGAGEKSEEAPEAERATVGGGSEYTSPEWLGTAAEIGLNPAQRLAKTNRGKKEEGGKQGALTDELSLLRSKLSSMENMLKELKSMYMEENHMNSARLKARARARKAYWLGGGGVNEPTPGKPKYEKEDADSIRDKEDKQMVGEPLDTGSDGLHPGDLEVKKKLLRAEEAEDRRIKRQALLDSLNAETEDKTEKDQLEERKLNRRAYWQGGGGINEPTPGKPKYEKEDSDSIRDKEDKQMVGDPLDTGSDGLHPGDMEVKKKWLRARLRAKFTKVADNQSNVVKEASKWDVFAGDKLVLTATGSEIYGEQLDDNWDYLSSAQYGQDLIKYIRTEGFDRTAWLLKGAQDPLAAAPAAPAPAAPAAEPMADLGAPAAPAPEAAKPAKTATQEKVEAALNSMEEKLSEVRELVVGANGSELVDVGVDVDSKKPAAAPASPMEGALASHDELMKVEALMDLSADELAEVSETLSNLDTVATENHEKVLNAAQAALSDSDTILAKAEQLIEAAKGKKKKDKKEDKKEEKKDEKKDEKEDKKEDKKDEKEAKAAALLEEALKVRQQNRLDLVSRAYGMELDLADDLNLSPEEQDALKKLPELMKQEKSEKGPGGELMHPNLADDMYAKDENGDKDDEKEEKEEKEDKKSKKKDKKEDKEDEAMYSADGSIVESDQSVLAARKASRQELLAKAAEYLGEGYQLDLDKAENATEPTYFEAHPGGKGTVTELTGTKTPEAKVETISEVHEVMRDVAESGPRNVREAAAFLQEQIVKGAMKAEDLDKLVAEGKVDSAAASYWKKYFGQAPDAGSFGADMSKEFASKKKEADDKNYRIKVRRAYDIGLEAQDKGLIGANREALETYVDEIMKFDDAAFESTKRVVASYRPNKRSGSVPMVGMDAATQAMEVVANAAPSNDLKLDEALLNLGWSGGGR